MQLTSKIEKKTLIKLNLSWKILNNFLKIFLTFDEFTNWFKKPIKRLIININLSIIFKLKIKLIKANNSYNIALNNKVGR